MPSPVIAAALRPAFRGYNSLFNAQFAETTPLWPQLAMQTPSTGEQETYGWMAETPGVREWVGSRVRNTLKLNNFTIINKKWEVTDTIPEDWVDDDKLSMFAPQAKILGANAKIHADTKILGQLVDGFVDTAYDGVAMYGTHAWKGADWITNSTLPLTASNFAARKQYLIEMLGHIGTKGEAPLNTNPQFLLVTGPALEATARSIIKMERVNGGDSNVNFNAADLLMLPYLRNNVGASGTVQAANYWYIIATNTPGGLMPFIMQMRRDWRTREITDDQEWIVFDQGVYVFGADARYNTGYGLWQTIVGSTGAGT